jgi:hypothetical protein
MFRASTCEWVGQRLGRTRLFRGLPLTARESALVWAKGQERVADLICEGSRFVAGLFLGGWAGGASELGGGVEARRRGRGESVRGLAQFKLTAGQK